MPMTSGNYLDWATPAEVEEKLIDVLQQAAGEDLDGEDLARLKRTVVAGMGVATGDILGYLCGGRSIPLTTLEQWAFKKDYYIDQCVYRTFERASGLSMPTQDKKPSQFDHRDDFRNKQWNPVDSAGNILVGEIVDTGEDDTIPGGTGRGNSSFYMGRLDQTGWDPRSNSVY